VAAELTAPTCGAASTSIWPPGHGLLRRGPCRARFFRQLHRRSGGQRIKANGCRRRGSLLRVRSARCRSELMRLLAGLQPKPGTQGQPTGRVCWSGHHGVPRALARLGCRRSSATSAAGPHTDFKAAAWPCAPWEAAARADVHATCRKLLGKLCGPAGRAAARSLAAAIGPDLPCCAELATTLEIVAPVAERLGVGIQARAPLPAPVQLLRTNRFKLSSARARARGKLGQRWPLRALVEALLP